MSTIQIGTASWTDKTLLQTSFYPEGVSTPEKRLRFYAEQFSIVEVDSTYYFPPTERNCALWIQRTPPDFTFHIKAYSLLTNHPTRPESLYADLRDQATKRERFLYASHLPESAMDEVWRRFVEALMPLHSSGKLGVVLFQFPQWFVPNDKNRDYIMRCQQRLADFTIAVEFRNGTWMNERTMRFLEQLRIPFTNVDMPQGFRSSMPPTANTTSKQVSYVRFHGRNVDQWDKPHATATPRFAYLYTETELAEWVPRLQDLATRSKQVHVLMNNCYSDHAVTNAKQLAAML
ncbi:MAG: DUF72 domain-containing protein [Actinomycetota bacterium]